MLRAVALGIVTIVAVGSRPAAHACRPIADDHLAGHVACTPRSVDAGAVFRHVRGGDDIVTSWRFLDDHHSRLMPVAVLVRGCPKGRLAGYHLIPPRIVVGEAMTILVDEPTVEKASGPMFRGQGERSAGAASVPEVSLCLRRHVVVTPVARDYRELRHRHGGKPMSDPGEDIPPANLIGTWHKITTVLCADKYPATITFSTGTYRGARGPGQGMVWWDAGIYRLEGPRRLVVSVATDELVTYEIAVRGDQLEVTDAEGCRFAYRRAPTNG
jgi:hypothetical protein